MFCPKCGKRQVENAKYCFSCGTRIVLPRQDERVVSVQTVSQKEKTNTYDHYSVEEYDPYDLVDDRPIRESRKRAKKKPPKQRVYILVAVVFLLMCVVFYNILKMQQARTKEVGTRYAGTSYPGIDYLEYSSSGTSASGSSNSRYSSSGTSDSGTSKATCKMCGKSWKAGDSGGNYMSIALRNMCNDCYKNYKQMEALKEALGY